MSMFQLGYLKPDDLVMINDTVVKSTGTFNLYAESKKMHWTHPELHSSDFVEYLIQRLWITPTTGDDINQSNTFEITHRSPNIFSLELIFGQYPKLLKLLSPVEIGLVGTWYNVYPHYKTCSVLFDEIEGAEKVSKDHLTQLHDLLSLLSERDTTDV